MRKAPPMEITSITPQVMDEISKDIDEKPDSIGDDDDSILRYLVEVKKWKEERVRLFAIVYDRVNVENMRSAHLLSDGFIKIKRKKGGEITLHMNRNVMVLH